MEEITKKKLTLGSVFGWLFGVLFALSGLVQIVSNTFMAVVFIVIAVLLLPPTYRYLVEKFNLSISRGARIGIIVVLFVLAVAVSNTSVDHKSADKKTSTGNSQSSTVKTPAIEVTSAGISQEYEDNGISAEIKYNDKLIKVTGTVDSIDKDILGTPYVSLKGAPYKLFGVQCMFKRGSEAVLSTISKGQQITLEGKVSGAIIGNVIVNDCSVAK